MTSAVSIPNYAHCDPTALCQVVRCGFCRAQVGADEVLMRRHLLHACRGLPEHLRAILEAEARRDHAACSEEAERCPVSLREARDRRNDEREARLAMEERVALSDLDEDGDDDDRLALPRASTCARISAMSAPARTGVVLSMAGGHVLDPGVATPGGERAASDTAELSELTATCIDVAASEDYDLLHAGDPDLAKTLDAAVARELWSVTYEELPVESRLELAAVRARTGQDAGWRRYAAALGLRGI